MFKGLPGRSGHIHGVVGDLDTGFWPIVIPGTDVTHRFLLLCSVMTRSWPEILNSDVHHYSLFSVGWRDSVRLSRRSHPIWKA
jgi:hypothetical protein